MRLFYQRFLSQHKQDYLNKVEQVLETQTLPAAHLNQSEGGPVHTEQTWHRYLYLPSARYHEPLELSMGHRAHLESFHLAATSQPVSSTTK